MKHRPDSALSLPSSQESRQALAVLAFEKAPTKKLLCQTPDPPPHTHPTPLQALLRRTADCREGRRTPLLVTAEMFILVLDVWPGAKPALKVP